MPDAAPEAVFSRGVVAALLPFSLAVFVGFLAIGIPLPVLPLQVHDTLGYGAVVVGLVIGAQSLATLLTRQFAGGLCDRRGTRPTAIAGFCAASLAGVLYLASTLAGSAGSSLAVLVAGRLILGFGESLFITATAAWSIARVGPAHAGRALAWQGIAMYGAMAIGAALGGAVEGFAGFAAVAGLAVMCPLAGAALAWMLPAVAGVAGKRHSFLHVLATIWRQGAALALASSGFGTIAAFLALRYQAAGWHDPGLALLAFGGAYIGVRLMLSGLPDRIGGRRVAMVCLLVEAAGEALIWRAWSPLTALAGVALAGLGYSLVFPALGVEAMRRVRPQDRGLAIGAFLGCFDLGLGAAGPVAGVVAAWFGLEAAFLAAGVAALMSLLLVARQRNN